LAALWKMLTDLTTQTGVLDEIPCEMKKVTHILRPCCLQLLDPRRW